VYPTGNGPLSIAVGDFDGDGSPDLATANVEDESVSVLIGDGAGEFGANVDYEIGRSPRAVAVGDVDGDGDADLVTANPASSTASVLLGDGAGGFAEKEDYSTGTGPVAIAVEDVDGDGTDDVATANAGAGTVSVLLADGTGRFAAHVDCPTGASPNDLAVGDLDSDGRADVVTANSAYPVNTVSVLFGDGTGGFAERRDVATDWGPRTVAVADLDGDGKADLATANATADTASVLLGDSEGGSAPRRDLATRDLPLDIAVGDVDGDGRADLATAHRDGDRLSLLLGRSPSQGPKVVEAEYRDWAGNVLNVSASIVLDTVPPTAADNTDDAWHPSFLLTLNGDDATSGIDHFVSRVDGGEWQTGGSLLLRTWKRGGNSGVHAVTYTAVDAAGNERVHRCLVLLDARPPRTSDDAPRDPAGQPLPQASDVTVRLTATDPLSGVSTTWCALDGGPWLHYNAATGILVSAPSDGSNDGTHWIAYYSTDHAGNVEYARLCAVVIDAGG
jgi:hypothetical protein